MSFWTLYSIARQMTRMVPDPSERYQHQKRAPVRLLAVTGGCGLCPACRDFVCIEPSGPDGDALCPHCGAWIDALEPPGGA